MHKCCFVVSFWFSLEQPLCSSMNRESIWCSQGLRNSIAWPHVAPRVFIAYFLKKNTRLRNFILKIVRVERGLSYQFQLVFIWLLLELELGWEKPRRRSKKEKLKTADRTWRYTTTASGSVNHRRVRSQEDGFQLEVWPDSVCIRSSISGRVRSFRELSITLDRTWRRVCLTKSGRVRLPWELTVLWPNASTARQFVSAVRPVDELVCRIDRLFDWFMGPPPYSSFSTLRD
jgi:hypothetical protein